MGIRTTALLLAIVTMPALAQNDGQHPAAMAQDLTPAQREGQQELHRAAAAYRDGHFAEAQQHSEKALSLDPTNQTARLFIARTIHAQYKPGVDEPENLEKARQAIAAYQNILVDEPENEEAYKAVAALYSSIGQEESLRQWTLQRASNPNVSADKRAEAYAVLAGRYWDCSFKITELPENKIVEMKGNKLEVLFKKPKDDLDFAGAVECAASGLDMVELAIALDGDNETAWSYKAELLMEKAKLAEMDGRSEDKVKFVRAADDTRRKATSLADRRKRESKD